MTAFKAPINVITKLYKFVKPQEDDEQQLTMAEMRLLIFAYCATKVTMIDVMPEPVVYMDPQKKRKKRYQDSGTGKPAEDS